MKIWRRSVRRGPRCADASPACAEQHPAPTSPTESFLWLLTTWQGTLRVVVVLVVAAAALVGVMTLTPLRVEVGVVEIAPAGDTP